MTRMHKPELHAHMAQALQRQEGEERVGGSSHEADNPINEFTHGQATKVNLILDRTALNEIGVEIDDLEGNLHILKFSVEKGTAKIISTVQRMGDTIYLNNLHIAGDGTLTEAFKMAENLGTLLHAKKVIVSPGLRTTGLRKGKVPRILTIDIKQ